MLNISSMGQDAPPPPPPIPNGVHHEVHPTGPGITPPIIDPYPQPIVDPFVLPVIDPFVLPVVDPFVIPTVYPYLPGIIPTAHPPPDHIVYEPVDDRRGDGPHWLFYVLVALMAHYALVEKEGF